jgi:hypothetical protein
MSREDIQVLYAYIDSHHPYLHGECQPVWYKVIGYTQPSIQVVGYGGTIGTIDMSISLDEAIEEYKSLVNLPGELDLIK